MKTLLRFQVSRNILAVWKNVARVLAICLSLSSIFVIALHVYPSHGRRKIGVLFVGDSITKGWKKVPDVWHDQFGNLDPANFGNSGDNTQQVLWRIDHGELDDIDPKVVVLMIGSNNLAVGDTAD